MPRLIQGNLKSALSAHAKLLHTPFASTIIRTGCDLLTQGRGILSLDELGQRGTFVTKLYCDAVSPISSAT